MRIKPLFIPAIGMALAALVSCSEKGKLPVEEPQGERIPISLSTTIFTKATESSFENNDRVGLYVVNMTGGTHGKLTAASNHINNEPYTYKIGSWAPAKDLYWLDNKTHADFYCYYPYAESVTTVTALPFSVSRDQSTVAAHKGSDFLWGKTLDAAPSASPVEIKTSHRVAKVIVKVNPGRGYTEEMLASKDIQVTLCNLYSQATLDLSEGTVSERGSIGDIKMFKNADGWVAYVIPQAVKATDIVKVAVDGYEYKLNQTVTFAANKVMECTLTVNRTSEGVNIGIGDWDSDGTDFGGTLN